MLPSTILNTKSGTFEITDDGLETVTVNGPDGNGMAIFKYPTNGSPVWPTVNEWQCQANMSAYQFCYSWSSDNINELRNTELLRHNETFLRHNEIFVANTNTLYDLRDDIRAVKHRAVNVDAGIYTQKACWETGCDENTSLRKYFMETSPANPAISSGAQTLSDEYVTSKSHSFSTHNHTIDVANDIPQVTPRTSGSV